MKKENKKGKQPVHRDRRGAVSASVFLNATKDGKEFPSVVIRRSYKTEQGYKDSSSYGGRHLAQLAELVASLQSWINANYPETAK